MRNVIRFGGNRRCSPLGARFERHHPVVDLGPRPRDVEGDERQTEGEHPDSHRGQEPKYAAHHEHDANNRTGAVRQVLVSPPQDPVGERSDFADDFGPLGFRGGDGATPRSAGRPARGYGPSGRGGAIRDRPKATSAGRLRPAFVHGGCEASTRGGAWSANARRRRLPRWFPAADAPGGSNGDTFGRIIRAQPVLAPTGVRHLVAHDPPVATGGAWLSGG